jgi:hypothetical protein
VVHASLPPVDVIREILETSHYATKPMDGESHMQIIRLRERRKEPQYFWAASADPTKKLIA